ncbi:MAG: hypothetical protein E5X92_27815, partial [Mesorhizobium sp.]
MVIPARLSGATISGNRSSMHPVPGAWQRFRRCVRAVETLSSRMRCLTYQSREEVVTMPKTGPGWEQAYQPLEFAQKHGLTLRQAEIVIQTNGPSKYKCDLAAPIFLKALK